jgi:RNA-binding protein
MSNVLNVDSIENTANTVKKGELVRMTSPDLTGKDRRHLRSLGHHLNPVVQIGQRGLFETLANAVDEALETHELIKVKVMDNCPRDLQTCALWVHEATGAHIVQLIGNNMLAYRPREKDPEIRLPSS